MKKQIDQDPTKIVMVMSYSYLLASPYVVIIFFFTSVALDPLKWRIGDKKLQLLWSHLPTPAAAAAAD